MKIGLFIGSYTSFANPEIILEFSEKAENLGFDGIFLPDHLHYGNKLKDEDGMNGFLDPWMMLSAIATQTSTIKLGTWITPIPRRQPWQLARNLATLDVLSKGRVILGAGLGSPPEDFEDYGIPYNPKILAEKMDEALDIINGLWQDGEFSYSGKHYTINKVDLYPKPVQQPRIPIMIAGRWPAKQPIRRGARWDGIMPIGSKFPQTMTDDEIDDLLAFYRNLTDNGSVLLSLQEGSPPPSEFLKYCRSKDIDWVLFPIGPMIGSYERNHELLEHLASII